MKTLFLIITVTFSISSFARDAHSCLNAQACLLAQCKPLQEALKIQANAEILATDTQMMTESTPLDGPSNYCQMKGISAKLLFEALSHVFGELGEASGFYKRELGNDNIEIETSYYSCLYSAIDDKVTTPVAAYSCRTNSH